jgi:hypothetical protein
MKENRFSFPASKVGIAPISVRKDTVSDDWFVCLMALRVGASGQNLGPGVYAEMIHDLFRVPGEKSQNGLKSV